MSTQLYVIAEAGVFAIASETKLSMMVNQSHNRGIIVNPKRSRKILTEIVSKHFYWSVDTNSGDDDASTAFGAQAVHDLEKNLGDINFIRTTNRR